MFGRKTNISNPKAGFGIVEVMVSIVVLGFMYVALSKLQVGNHDAFIRIRGRDGAVEVAQQVMDSLRSIGAQSIASRASTDTTLFWNKIPRSWDRGLGGQAIIEYEPIITVYASNEYVANDQSNYETISHIYAKQVNVKVQWKFKGSTQSIDVSGVIR